MKIDVDGWIILFSPCKWWCNCPQTGPTWT